MTSWGRSEMDDLRHECIWNTSRRRVRMERTKLREVIQSRKLLRELLYLYNLVAIELHKNSLGGRLTINPIFYFVSIRSFLANLPVRTSQRRNYHFAIHPNRGPLIPNGILNVRRQSINPLHGCGMLF